MNPSPPQAPTLAEDLHALRERIAAQLLAARLHAVIAQALLAVFAQIFDILERMVADWAAGRLPAPRATASRRTARSDSARREPTRHHGTRHPRARAHSQCPAETAAPSRQESPRVHPWRAATTASAHPPHDGAHSASRRGADARNVAHLRAHPPPHQKFGAWAKAPSHAHFVTIS